MSDDWHPETCYVCGSPVWEQVDEDGTPTLKPRRELAFYALTEHDLVRDLSTGKAFRLVEQT